MMKRILQLIALFGGIIALAALANRGAADGGDGDTAGSMGPAPAWDLPLVGGDRLSSAELQEAFEEKGVVFVGVSLDQGPGADGKVGKFIEEYKINYPIVMGDMEVVEAFGGVVSIPTTFVIDREGQIVRRKVGYKPKAYFEELLSSLH